MNRLAVLAAACLLAAPAFAQGTSQREELEKKMNEISSLMRESERLLLEITQVDRLVAEQREVVRKLEELENQAPQAPQNAEERTEREQQKEELEQQQQEVQDKLRRLFEGQNESAATTVVRLQELLKSLPRRRGQSPSPQDQQNQPKPSRPDPEKNLKEREEQQQRDPNQPREKREQEQTREGKKPKQQTEAARLRLIEAWIARLPPEVQERINRNDYTAIPARYRRLVREYTALRAKRETERAAEESPR